MYGTVLVSRHGLVVGEVVVGDGDVVGAGSQGALQMALDRGVDPVADFPNALCTSSTATNADNDFVIGNRCVGSSLSVTNTRVERFDVNFWAFTLTAPQQPDPVVFTAGAATPSGVGPGASSLLTVTASGVPTAVTADLSAFGLSAAEAFRDDGMSGDAAAGDGIWSYALTVPMTQMTGAYPIMVNGTVAACNPPSRTITLNVTPPNNTCANAIPIMVGGSYPGTTLGALGAGGTATACNTITSTNPGVWYVFTETSLVPRRLSLNLCDPVTDFDAQIAVYWGSCGSFTCVWGNDTSGVGCPIQNPNQYQAAGTTHSLTPSILNWTPGNTPTVTKCTQPGQTYYIAVTNRTAANGGNFVLHLDETEDTCEGTPAINSTCAGGRAVTGFPYWDVVYPNESLADTDNATCNDPGSTSIRGGLWYRFTAAESGTLYHTRIPDQGTAGSATDSILAVYSVATDCTTLTEVACVDAVDNATAIFANPVASLSAGTTYYLLAANYSGTATPSQAAYIGFDFIPNPGACCTAGVCSLTNGAAACTSGGGVYQGEASTCSPDPCSAPTNGACCRGTTCSVDTSANCTGANTLYGGDGTVCNVFGTNNTSPCCLADFNHVGGITVQDIFDFLAAYFSASPLADINGGGIGVQDIFDYLAAYFGGGC